MENSLQSGLSAQNVMEANSFISGKVTEKPEKVTEEQLQTLVTALAKLAYISKIVINESLVPGDMIEEAYEAKILCQHVLDRWVEKEDEPAA